MDIIFNKEVFDAEKEFVVENEKMDAVSKELLKKLFDFYRNFY